MAVVNWEDEMSRMLSGFEHQAMTSLKIIKMSFKNKNALLDPKFKERFFKASNNRLVETYDRFEMNLLLENPNMDEIKKGKSHSVQEINGSSDEEKSVEKPPIDYVEIDVDISSDESKDVKSHIKLEQNNDRCKILGLMKTPIDFVTIDDSEDEESETNAPQPEQITLTNEVMDVNPTIVESQSNEIVIKQKADIQAKKEESNDNNDIPIVPAGFNSHNACNINSANFGLDYAWEEKDFCQNDLKFSVRCEKVNGQGNTTSNNGISHAQILDDIMEIDDSDDDKNVTKENNTTFKRKKPSSKTTSQSKIRNRIKCQVCDLFSIKDNLKRHMRTHTGEKPHQCDRCPKSFTRVSHLRIHMEVHAKEFPFNCSRCLSGFSVESEKILHEKMCNTIRYECDVCKKFTTTNKSHLKRHMLVHSGEKPFRCEICMKSFTFKSDLKKHLRTVHKEKPMK